MFRKDVIWGAVLLALVLVISVFILTAVSGPTATAVAHHNAPVDNNVTTGNLNQDMVHNGIEERNNSNGAEQGVENWAEPLG